MLLIVSHLDVKLLGFEVKGDKVGEEEQGPWSLVYLCDVVTGTNAWEQVILVCPTGPLPFTALG